jgi:uncharacterized protein (DUF1778 family)
MWYPGGKMPPKGTIQIKSGQMAKGVVVKKKNSAGAIRTKKPSGTFAHTRKSKGRTILNRAEEQDRTRITARVPAQLRETLEEAAAIIGTTINQFVVQSAFVEAQRVIERETIIRLSHEDAKKVFFLIDNPPKPNKKLKEAFRAHSEVFGD